MATKTPKIPPIIMATPTFRIPKLPKYTNPIADQDQANIRWLMNPNVRTPEQDTRAAELNLGMGGGGFANNRNLRLRDSEIIRRMTLGSQMAQPYLQREHATASQTQGERAQLEQIAATGAQAMERLRLQESGMTARQSAAERAALERAALEGEQAMERLRVSEGGQTSRQQAEINAALERFYAGEAGQNERLGRTIAAEGEQQGARISAADTQQLRDLENRLEVARITSSADAARLEQQLALERERIRGQMALAERESADRMNLARTEGAFRLASQYGGGGGAGGGAGGMARYGAGPFNDPASATVDYGGPMGGTRIVGVNNPLGGGQFSPGAGGDQYGAQLSNVDRILRRYGVV